MTAPDDNAPYAILGASGNTGAAAAEALAAQGARLRLLLRRDEALGVQWRARGAAVTVGDLYDHATLTAFLRGVRGAYLLMPPAITSDDPLAFSADIAHRLARAAREAGLPHAVILSSIAAHVPAGTGMILGCREFEQAFRAAGVTTTSLRPAIYMETAAPVIRIGFQTGVMPTLLTVDRPFEQVASRDVGRRAAQALRDGPAGAWRVIEFAGPRAWSPDEIAAEISRIAGRNVSAALLPRAQWTEAQTASGAGRAYAELVNAIAEAMNDGRVGFESATVERGATPLAPIVEQTVRAASA
jgi:uncharacterized protein YbjT (DUF2867 family)